MMQDRRIGFIGAGKMASSLASGFVSGGMTEASQVTLSDVYEAALVKMSNDGFATTMDNGTVIENSDIIFLAVKPDIVKSVLTNKLIHKRWNSDKTLVSICAGVTLDTLASSMPQNASIIRVMPNVCCLVKESASVYCPNAHVPVETATLVEKLLASVGLVYKVKESLISAVVSVSGSGPAYVLEFIDALACGGVQGGLPREIAQGLAAQTVKGAAALLLDGKSHPCQLRDMVCSPGGTTIAAVGALHENGLHNAVMKAVKVCRDKDIELGKTNA